jgi:hypothetical protein
MFPPDNGAPDPELEPVVLMEWLAEEVVGLQSTIVMVVVALADTAAIVSMVICARTVAEVSFLLRLSLAIAVRISAIPASNPTMRITEAINISIMVKPAS